MIVEEVGACYRKSGIPEGACVAVAFSGGADSVALLAATRLAGMECVALHCNFHLRGDESNRDEEFARNMAARLGCEIRVRHFDVEQRRSATGESVEMACRELRYRWFEDEFNAAGGRWACVAVGHHADDNVETFFLNVFRGSGIKGLSGMPRKRDIFVRPLLSVPRARILEFLRQHDLDYVVDSTNLSNDYNRNVIRNRILPLAEECFPNVRGAVGLTMRNLRNDYELMQALLERERMRLVDCRGVIDLALLTEMPHASTLLFHLLNDSGRARFGIGMVESMLHSAGESGRRFMASGGEMGYLLDRGRLVPFDADGHEREDEPDVVPVDAAVMLRGGTLEWPLRLRFERLPRSRFRPSRNASVVWFDADALLAERLELRRWHRGDRISPFGMRGSRLVSDILSDAKISLLEKRNLWLLCAGEKVLWVPGLRASGHFAVTDATAHVIRITMQ